MEPVTVFVADVRRVLPCPNTDVGGSVSLPVPRLEYVLIETVGQADYFQTHQIPEQIFACLDQQLGSDDVGFDRAKHAAFGGNGRTGIVELVSNEADERAHAILQHSRQRFQIGDRIGIGRMQQDRQLHLLDEPSQSLPRIGVANVQAGDFKIRRRQE